MIKKRKNFSKSVKEEELRRAHYRCRKCHKKLDIDNKLYHFDHKDNNWDNSQKNCVVLCLDDHWLKTYKQLKRIPHTEYVRRGKIARRKHRNSWVK